jgi:hypothetical protein
MTDIAGARGIVPDHHRTVQYGADLARQPVHGYATTVQTLKVCDRGGDFFECRSAMSSALTASLTRTKSHVWQPSP